MTAANRLLRRLGKRRNLLRLPRFVEHDGRQPKEDFVLHPVADDIVVALFSRHSSFWHVRPGPAVVALYGARGLGVLALDVDGDFGAHGLLLV